MSEVQLADSFGATSAIPSGPSSSKPRRRSIRPRVLPTDVRERLARLGLTPTSKDTKRENLQLLVNRMTADLNNYRAMANHWQKQCVDLKHAERREGLALVPVEASQVLPESWLNLEDRSRRSSDEVPAFDLQFIGKLNSTANPSLSLVEIGAPKVSSDVSRLVSNSTFRDVLIAISTMSSMDMLPNPLDQNSFPCMEHVKPNFDTQKVQKLWNDIFAPMSYQPSSVEYNASPSCRRSLEYELDDPDMDHFDRVLAGATDDEIVDMLQCTTMLIGGMHQVVFDDPSLAPARIHLGRSCERILREAIFTRNLTSSPELASGLMDGLLGTFCHFATHGMASAVLSILNLAWLILTLHSQLFVPTMRILLAAYFLIAGPEQQRNTWIQRIHEGLALSSSTTEKPFPAILMTSVAMAYGALLTGDDGALLQQTALLEDILSPTTPEASSIDSQSNSSSDLWIRPSGIRISPTSIDFDAPMDLPELDFTSPESADMAYTLQEDQLFGEWKSVSEEDWKIFGRDVTQTPTTPSSAVTTVVVDSDCWVHMEDGVKYVPGENLKALNRILLYLIRAEASLALKDYETCMHWVDEAEQTLLSIPLDCLFQRVFLMKNVIKTTCPFPTGERSVVDEFERRLLAHETTRSGRTLSPERISIGVLWRTP